jgi:hypothetical protein
MAVRPLAFAAALAAALAGAALVAAGTRHGIGLSPDSATYVGAARSLQRGDGLLVPFDGDGPRAMTHYPPLYPALLAVAGEPFHGARWLACALLAANLLVVGLALPRVCPRGPWLAVFGALVALLGQPMLAVHGMAWSEPPFLLLAVLGIVLTARYVEKPASRTLLLGGMAAGLAWLTRYAGAACVAAGALAILLAGVPLRRRLRDAALFILIASTPMAAWVIRNMVVAGTPVNRPIALRPISLERITEGWDTCSQWLLPGRMPLALRAGVLALILCATAWRLVCSRRSGARDAKAALAWAAGLFAAAYVGVIVLTVLLVDAYTHLDWRILSPIFPTGVILGVWLADDLAAALRQRPWPQALAVAACAALIGLHGIRTWGWLREGLRDGRGYSGREWRQSDVLARVSGLPPDARVFTNGPDAVYLLTGRSATMTPDLIVTATWRPNPRYRQQMDRLRTALQDQGAVLVYLDALASRSYQPSEQTLIAELGLRASYRGRDGTIYVSAGEGTASTR